jgi:hypothetical protein
MEPVMGQINNQFFFVLLVALWEKKQMSHKATKPVLKTGFYHNLELSKLASQTPQKSTKINYLRPSKKGVQRT